MPVAMKSDEKVEVVDDGLRTVLHGYGKLPANDVHYIDGFKFVGGVCRDVPVEQAEAWQKGERIADPDKKYALPGKRAYGRVVVQVLPSKATEADYARATGFKPVESKKFAAILAAYTADEIREALGEERTLKLASALKDSVLNTK